MRTDAMRWWLAILLWGCHGAYPDDPSTDCNELHEGCGPDDCPGEGERMLPGSDCLGCHNAEAADDSDLIFNLAGTIFLDEDGTEPLTDARIRITDAEDQLITLSPNEVGNFWSRRSLVFPAHVEVETDDGVIEMPAPLREGSCNKCHACEGNAEAKLHGP